MQPVLQLANEEDLKSASAHLATQGYPSKVLSFSDLRPDDYADWMKPDEGGYVLCIPHDEKYEAAMTCLGLFFGYSES